MMTVSLPDEEAEGAEYMSIEISPPHVDELKPRIAVIGVGGAPAQAPILGALPRVTTPAKGRDQPARAAQHRRR